MPRLKSALIAAALSVVALSPLAAATSSAGESDIRYFTGAPFDTTDDLGFDVSEVPHNPTAVKAYIAGLPSSWQPLVLAACAHFITTPQSYRTVETYGFCLNAFE